LLLALVFATAVAAQTDDPAFAPLTKAYQALWAKNYDAAIEGFQRAAALAPDRPAIRQDLAYTLLKVGDTDGARDQFAEALRLDPSNDQVALEYAFLCYETKQPVIARRIFERLAKAGNVTAREAFENVDRPLREGIARWQETLRLRPDNFSAHEELARLAEQRDELALQPGSGVAAISHDAAGCADFFDPLAPPVQLCASEDGSAPGVAAASVPVLAADGRRAGIGPNLVWSTVPVGSQRHSCRRSGNGSMARRGRLV
jgi:tetratricopeptide (TPR) repeat protein